MQKPKVFNRTLSKKWAEEENVFIINKLNNVKAKVNIQCPESYVFYQTQFKKTQARNNKLKQFEIEKDNQLLFDKIMNILTINPNEECKIKLNFLLSLVTRQKPKFVLKKDIYSQAKKYDYFKISQENQYLFKRLNDKNSIYDTKAWEKDYDKSQSYKKNICVFPSIDFKKTKLNDLSLKNYPKGNKSLAERIKNLNLNDITSSNKEKGKQNLKENNFLIDNMDRYTQISKDSSNMKIILFQKKIILSELSHCSVTFSIHNKKFLIEVESIKNEKSYYLEFDDSEEIQKIQKLYIKYEHIITDLDYDFINDTVYIKNKGNINLNYKSSSIRNQDRIIALNGNANANDNNYISDRENSSGPKEEQTQKKENNIEFTNNGERKTSGKIYQLEEKLQNIQQIRETENDQSQSMSSFTNDNKSSSNSEINLHSSIKIQNDKNVDKSHGSIKYNLEPADQIDEEIN